MKKSMFVVLGLFVACVFAAGSVSAETVKGTVGKVDAAAKKVAVSKTNDDGAVEVVEIAVNEATGYVGVAALEEVKEGNQVTIEAEKEEAGPGWVAKSVAVVTE